MIHPKSIRKWVVSVLLTDAGIAMAVPLLRSFFDSEATAEVLLRQYGISVLYANLIGVPIAAFFPTLWIRTARQPVGIRLMLRCNAVVLANLVGCLLAGLILKSLIPSYSYWSEFRGSFGLSLVLSAIVVAFVSMYESQEDKVQATAIKLKNNEIERERALKLASEARLSSLESRIHPHFLFNTINSVSALIHDDPLRAERILTQLAELLRFSLDAAPGGLVPLERELHIVEDYLDIEKARFGERLRYRIHVASDLYAVAVPPLSIQTLVENSVKYAVGPRLKGASLDLQVSECPEGVRIVVRDDGPGFSSTDWPKGHGLSNLQERLAVLYGGAAEISAESSQSGTAVSLTLPVAVNVLSSA